jgi:ribosome-associated protein YbcJ (S4-like RNA binding protein)
MADRVSIMNLRQLLYWLAVVDTGSFTKAAQQLHEKAGL